MRLLFDQNLSPRLVKLLETTFPDAGHVADLQLGEADDDAVWVHAQEHGFCIVTKDADFSDFSTTRGAPPKVIWLRIGNCSTNDVVQRFLKHADEINSFARRDDAHVLVIR